MSEPNYLTIDEATELVERVSSRAFNFDYVMHDNEKAAMAQLLSDVGVSTSDLVSVHNLADNYAINAEIVTPSEMKNYNKNVKEDALFIWEEEDGTHYCLSW